MPKPYTVRLFVPEGDPSSFKIIDKMNWTGVGIEISRESWHKHKNRNELNQAGIYIFYLGIKKKVIYQQYMLDKVTELKSE